MGQERLSSFCLLNIEAELLQNMEFAMVIDSFSAN